MFTPRKRSTTVGRRSCSTSVRPVDFRAFVVLISGIVHDVLPGSAIGMVYDDAEVLYGEVKKDGEQLLEEAFSVLFPSSVPLSASTRTKTLAGSCKIVAYNTTFFPRLDIVKIPIAKAGSSLRSQIMQASDNGKEGYAIMHCPNGGAPGELKAPSNGLHAYLKPVSGACRSPFSL